MPRSPISLTDSQDDSPVPDRAVATATGETLWALVELLVERAVIDPGDLVAKLRPAMDATRRAGPIRTNEDRHQLATALALERVVAALEKMR